MMADDKIEHMIDEEQEDKIEDTIDEELKDMIEDKKVRTRHLDMINERIDHVNLLARIRNDFSKNVEEICRLMNKLHNEIYSDDSRLRLVELNKINMLLDEALDYVWKTLYDKNREKHERINIDKYKDIDGYVSKYTNIVNDKLELVNRIGEILDCAMIEVQNEVDMINEVKQKEGEIDIETLKLMHEALTKILKKWRDIILEMINRDSACSKADTQKKDNEPATKKKDNKPDTEKKDNKLDTSKNNIENRVSNRVKYEIQDIAKYRKLLIKMIHKRINMLDLISLRLVESIDDVYKNLCKFMRLCSVSQINIMDECMMSISRIYEVNVVLECLRDGVGNGIWPEGISYYRITIINEKSLKKYYKIIALEKTMLIKAVHEEIEMVRRLIETNVYKYENIINGAGEMDIYAIDQACADIDKTIGYIRKIVIEISSIAEKKWK